MSTITQKVRQAALSAATIFALSFVFTAPTATAQDYWTPDQLAAELIKKFSATAQIESGVLYLTDGEGKMNTYLVDPSGTPIPRVFTTTFSTGVSKSYGECATPIIYSSWAGPMFVKWCSNPASSLKVKSAYYFYYPGGYVWLGSQLWDCELQVDYYSLPPLVKIEICQ